VVKESRESRLRRSTKLKKICIYGIDAAASWGNLSVPLDAGPGVIGVVLVHFGTANWLNFVPTTINGNPPGRASCDSKVGGEVEFFLPKKMREAAGFFDIYIQGSKKKKVQL
jgi:hypothetical protein